MKELNELVAGLTEPEWLNERRPGGMVSGISRDSRSVAPGDVFVAIRGTQIDSHDHVAQAVEQGARAVVVERPVDDPGVPVIRVENTRRALAELAAVWHDHPAEKLALVGITGTLGKTSVLAMLEAILRHAKIETTTIGSLGIRVGDAEEETGHTVPGALTLQRALAQGVENGAAVAAMEVTSHALVQDRVHGLHFHLGIFTTLVPLEHMEYHGTFADYVEAKSRFFDHLRPGAPLVYGSDNLALHTLVEERPFPAISCGMDAHAAVRMESLQITPEGTRLDLRFTRELPCLRGQAVTPGVMPLELRLLGRSNASNAALAATAALCLGAPHRSVHEALRAMEPPRRRMNVVHRGRFTVLDDTVGHPDSISAVFQVVEALPHQRVHVAFAIRGQRGAEINRSDADAIALWTERVGASTLFVTPSLDAADERNTVAPDEREAFLGRLGEMGCAFEERPRLDETIEAVLGAADDGDLVLLLGAQGMDAGSEIARSLLSRDARSGESERSGVPAV